MGSLVRVQWVVLSAVWTPGVARTCLLASLASRPCFFLPLIVVFTSTSCATGRVDGLSQAEGYLGGREKGGGGG